MAQLTFVAGDVLTASQLNTYCMGEGGAWTSYTPTVTQSGVVTNTTTYSKYARYGRTIHYSFRLTMTGAGTATNNATVTLPVTAASTSGLTGVGYVFDASTGTNYVCAVLAPTTSTVYFVPDGLTAAWGVTPNLALAASDLLVATITYEAAS